MAENSKIEWTDHTASPWYGCSKVHAGCDHCYAETMARINPGTLGIWGVDGTRVKSMSFVDNLRKWNNSAAKRGVIESVFPSICDPFEDRPELEPWRREMFEAIDECQNLRLLLLTKRPENIRRMWPTEDDGAGGRLAEAIFGGKGRLVRRRDNCWLGTSISDQASADKQIPELLKCRDLSPVLFLSAEPLLGPIDLTNRCRSVCGENRCTKAIGHEGTHFALRPTRGWDNRDEPVFSGIDWVIVGGESGPKARPMHPDWARSIRDQCACANVPFFFKQWGEWAPSSIDSDAACHNSMPTIFLDGKCLTRFGKHAAGRMLDGRTWDEFPVAESGVAP